MSQQVKLPPKPPKKEIPPAPGSARVTPRRRLTPAARLGSQLLFVVLLVAIIGVVTYPFWRPIVFPDPVTTRFSQLPREQQTAINSLPAEQRDLLVKLADQNPQQAVDTALALLGQPLYVSDDISFIVPLGQTPTLIKAGTFTQVSAIYGAVGTAQIYKYGSTSLLSLSEFEAKLGPELHLALAPEAAPTIATRDTWVDLGILKGQAGTIIYTLPNTVNVDAYQSVVIFDARYGTLNSVAALQ